MGDISDNSNKQHHFQRVNDIIFMPGKDETKMHHLFVDTSEEIWHLYSFSCGMSNMSIGVTSISHISSIQ